MGRIALSFILLASLAGATACEKADEPKGSGALAATDLELFKSLPGNANALFGGNYMKLQDFMTSSLGKMASKMTENLAPGMKDWMACFVDKKDMTIAGAVLVKGKGAEMRMAFRGITLKEIEACAKKASFPAAMDADNKYVSVEIPSPQGKQTSGYLQLASGSIYTRQAFTMLGASASVTPGTRPDLEGDIAGIKESAADNANLQGILKKVDRTKTVWFAGTGAGTPIADKVGEMYGSIEVSPGVAVDISAQLVDSKLAEQAEEGIAQLKKQASQAPPELRSLIEGVKFKRNGDRVRFAAKISDAQLEMLMKQAGGSLGGF